MKKTAKLVVLTVLASGYLVSQSWAANSVDQERFANEDRAYFEQIGQTASTSNVTHNPNYEFAANPMEHAAARNEAYWSEADHFHTKVSYSKWTPFQGAAPSPKGYVFTTNRQLNQ